MKSARDLGAFSALVYVIGGLLILAGGSSLLASVVFSSNLPASAFWSDAGVIAAGVILLAGVIVLGLVIYFAKRHVNQK
jgi:hypothetical protein